MALAVVLIAQTVFFFAFLEHPIRVQADNDRYEIAGYNLAIGRGIALPVSVSSDGEVHGWVCQRHPGSCHPDGTHPTAIYPPGYSVMIAAVYKLVGRSLVALISVHLALLLFMFVLFERLAGRLLDCTGYHFAMGVAAVYPFIARQAALVMSDHLHVVLFFAALATFYLLGPGIGRGLLFGGLMGSAVLVRTYSLLVLPVLWLWPSVWRAAKSTRAERLAVVLSFCLLLGAWAARNTYWFGRFVPLGTGGPGVLLMHTTMEMDADRYGGEAAAFYGELEKRIGGYDIMSREGDRRLRALAMERIREHPFRFSLVILSHIPKLWVSLGSQRGLSRTWPALVIYLGGLWLLGLVGGWIVRRNARWHALMVAIGTYWLFLLYSPGEARRTLPLRLPMLLLASVAVSSLLHKWRTRVGDPDLVGSGGRGVIGEPQEHRDDADDRGPSPVKTSRDAQAAASGAARSPS